MQGSSGRQVTGIGDGGWGDIRGGGGDGGTGGGSGDAATPLPALTHRGPSPAKAKAKGAGVDGGAEGQGKGNQHPSLPERASPAEATEKAENTDSKHLHLPYWNESPSPSCRHGTYRGRKTRRRRPWRLGGGDREGRSGISPPSAKPISNKQTTRKNLLSKWRGGASLSYPPPASRQRRGRRGRRGRHEENPRGGVAALLLLLAL